MAGWRVSTASLFLRGLFRSITCGIAFVLLCAGSNTAVAAEYKKLRYDEEYSASVTKAQQTGWLDRIKYIPLFESEDAYVSLGGEYRLRYEYTRSPGFGEAGQDKRGVLFQRLSVHADNHFSRDIRVFLHLMSALEAGRRDGPSPVEENKLEFQNAFLDYSIPGNTVTRNTFRFGRQEINLGSGRLVDVREGPNVRRSFDGFRYLAARGEKDLTLFALRPRLSQPGAFDDRSDKEKALWGVYSVLPLRKLFNAETDLYYLGFRDDNASYEQGTDAERRHSLGARFSARNKAWQYNWEAVYQFGEFGNGNIQAWTLATVTGYRFDALPWRPLVSLSANVASGDKNPDDADLQTFNPLFPRGNYFSEAAVLGPRNFYNLHPFITVFPNRSLTLTADMNFFWRYETSDGIYGPSGNLVRASNGSRERYVGTALSFNSEWVVNRHLVLTAIYSHWMPGAFIKETGPSGDIDFIELTAHFRF